MAAPQYFFVSHRNVLVNSTLGHAIRFEKGKPTHVPKALHSMVLERGCLPCDAEGKELDAPAVSLVAEAAEGKVVRPVAPEDAGERAAAIEEAIGAVVKRNSPKDFTAGGVPSATSVSSQLGWTVDQKDIRPIWTKVKPILMGGKPE